MKVGDLVWHDDYLLNEMAILLGYDPPTDTPFGEDYAWIFVIKGVNSGQKRGVLLTPSTFISVIASVITYSLTYFAYSSRGTPSLFAIAT